MLVVDERGDELRLRWPLWPRLRRYILPLVGLVAWSSLGFTVADFFDATPGAAFGIAVLPSIVMLTILAPNLANEFVQRTIIFRRRGSTISVGALDPVAPEQFAIDVAPSTRWGRAVWFVVVRMRTIAVSTPIELGILYEPVASQDEAEQLAAKLRAFVGATLPT